MNYKRCGKCKKNKILEDFYVDDGQYCSPCKECRLKSRTINYANKTKEEKDILTRKSCKRQKDQREWINTNHLASRHIAKIRVFSILGTKCDCCGETIREFLSLDHVNGDGNKDKKKRKLDGGGFWARILKEIKEECPINKYRTLCFNCNCAKGFLGYCPHEIENPGVL